MLDRVHAAYPMLPPSEQAVADLLIADPRAFTTAPMARLAAQAGVSEPTVLRFCRSVGCTGLTDLKLQLAGTLGQSLPASWQTLDGHETGAGLVAKCADHALVGLLGLRGRAAGGPFDAAIEALASAVHQRRRIALHGSGVAGCVAQWAQLRLLPLGAHAHACTDEASQAASLARLEAGDCLLLFAPEPPPRAEGGALTTDGRRATSWRDAGGAPGDGDGPAAPATQAEAARQRGATTILVAPRLPVPPAAAWTGSRDVVLLELDVPDAAGHPARPPSPQPLLQALVAEVLATGVAQRLGNDRDASLR